MRKPSIAVGAVVPLVLLAGCTVAPAPTPGPTASTPGISASSATPASTVSPSPSTEPSAGASPTSSPGDTPSEWANPSNSTWTPSPSASPSSSVSPADSLEAAFAQPQDGGIAAFLNKHREYLPATVAYGSEVISGASKGPLDISLKNVPTGTTRIYMAIACTASRPYKMDLTRDDGSSVATSWGDSCGYWGGLNGYTTSPFDPSRPPTKLTITVDADTHFSYVLYASPGR